MSGLASLRAARPLGIPVAQTFHALGVVKRRNQGVRDTSPAARLEIEADVARSVDRVLATCSDEVFELLRLGVQRRRVSVVPGGVDLRRFGADGPREEAPPGAGPRVLALGRLVARKGFGNVIEAIAQVPDAHLVIAGGPDRTLLDRDPEAVRFAALARELGVADRVELRGCVDRDHVAPLLRSADVLVSVPWYEPFGIVPVEAMACGVPVIVSAVGGLTDTIVHGVTGLHVPPRRPDVLAAALRELLADPARRAELGAAGARRARERYGWDRIAGQTLRAYGAIAAGDARRAARKEGPR
jgi:glycosyltransferase involved in cell wall biosynthesis